MEIPDQFAIVDHDRVDPGLAEGLDQQFFFLSNQRVQ
jgi:hypothetical protein